MSAVTFHRAVRSFPNDIAVGDQIAVRKSSTFGYFTDAGTVARGKSATWTWCTVTAVEKRSNGRYAIDNDGPINIIWAAANSKLIVRKPVAP